MTETPHRSATIAHLKYEIKLHFDVEALVHELPTGKVVIVTEDDVGSTEQWDEIFSGLLPVGIVGENMSLDDFDYDDHDEDDYEDQVERIAELTKRNKELNLVTLFCGFFFVLQFLIKYTDLFS